MPSERRRLDQLLVERGLVESRTRAATLIGSGLVSANGTVQDKPSRSVPADVEISVEGLDHPWASRAGIKLDSALDLFAIAPAGLIALDIGASTGGFTDVLLARGARLVYAVDVGHGQLTPRLRDDPRIVSLENTNARHLSADAIGGPIGIIVCDASFISLETILPAPMALAGSGTILIALIKPQFEVGPGKVGKGGIVRDQALHEAVCARIAAWLSSQPGWVVRGVENSPIAGTDGNKEFLICAVREN